jgi:tetratricopeptide (TPR) repeat protein
VHGGIIAGRGVTIADGDAKITSVMWRMTVLLLAASVVMGEAPPPGAPNHWLEVIRLGEVEVADMGPEQALVAAELARRRGDESARRRALERAAADGPLAEVARLELARDLADDDPGTVLGLVVPTLRRWGTRELLDGAVDLAVAALKAGAAVPEDLPGLVTHLPRAHRRRLTVMVADPGTVAGRRDLLDVLRRSQRDLPSLTAARELLRDPEQVEEVWLAAKALYLHGLYDEAKPLLERLAESGSGPAPPWEAPFLRGRCDFRLGRFDEAARWYRIALGRARDRDDVAEMWVHIGRCQELLGDPAAAAESARQAVVAKASDDRRLFLSRLRLRTGREDLALQGIRNMKARSSRARGWQLVGLYRLEHGQLEPGLEALDRANRNPWFGPSQVLAAEVELQLGRPQRAIQRLERAASALDVYWLQQAHELMVELPPETLRAWRDSVRAELESGRRARSALARWSRLEPDPEILQTLRRREEVAATYRVNAENPPQPRRLAGRLWGLGLRELAVRWDPGAFPRGSAAETLWTARRFLDAGHMDLAIRSSDAAWRQAGSDLPIRVQPRELREALYPLPWTSELVRIGERSAVPWSLVAAVAREESRWDPDTLSVVGARGVMQIMPATAVAAAQRAGLPSPTPEDLFDPVTSLTLGATELARLMAEFDGDAAASVAAYNAGSAQSRLWLDAFPESSNEARFVASLTFRSTRAYTADALAGKRIIEERASATIRWPTAAPTPTVAPPRNASPRGGVAPAPSTDRSPR